MDTKMAQPARGMRDLMPALVRRRRRVIDSLVETFERFAFVPLETPALERAETLLGKYGPDAERLIFRAGLRGEQDLALRYDHSVPLARVCAATEDLPRPFRRYQVGPVWRGDRPQRGRYREFVQADVDIVGSAELLADAEIVAVALTALDRLGIGEYRLMLNNRQLLTAVGRHAGVPEALLPGLYRAIDKRDAVGLEGVRRELRSVGLPGELLNRQRQAVDRWLRGTADRDRLAADLAAAVEPGDPIGIVERAIPRFLEVLTAQRGDAADADALRGAEAIAMETAVAELRDLFPPAALVPEEAADRLLALLSDAGGDGDAWSDVASALGEAGRAGVDELRTVIDLVAAAGLPMDRVTVDVAMVRGLEYYTGTIFEAVVPAAEVGSIFSGGRYDNLVGSFGRDMPAVGLSFGVDRVVVAMEALGMFAGGEDRRGPDVLVARFDDSCTAAALGLARTLRDRGFRAEMYLGLDRMGDQVRYALRNEASLLAVVGPDEVASGTVTVRDLRRRSERQVPLDTVATYVRDVLAEAVVSAGTGGSR